MVFGIYDQPDGSPLQAWSDIKIGDICDTVEFDYIRYFCGAGTFTLIIPRNSAYADKIRVGCFLISRAENINAENGYNGFIVKDIVYENDTLKITGYDLNGLLLDRITLYPQNLTDKAVMTGSTEKIVKYYVDYNCVSSTDTERNFPALGIAENQDRGIADDAASPRLECVADVVSNILGAQNMGYRIYPLLNKAGGAIMEFEVYEAVNRTQNQKENSRVTFSFGLGNVAQMKREIGVTADKNTFYCELSSGAVQRYYKNGEDSEVSWEDNVISGFDRREEYLKLGCELNEIEIYAEHEIADRYRLTDSLEITAGNPLDYGSAYIVGDIVTVYDRERKLQLDSIISAAEVKRTGSEYSVKITLGNSKPKVLDSYAKKGQATANSVRIADGTGSRITSYEYLSDMSVKLNGVTYTVEKNDQGIISKVYDDKGNSLEPVISGEITDISLHNAVFWAAAMSRGLQITSKPESVLAFEGLLAWFDGNTLPDGSAISDAINVTFTYNVSGQYYMKARRKEDGSLYMSRFSGERAQVYSAEFPVTFYLLVKAELEGEGYSEIMERGISPGYGYGVNIGHGHGTFLHINSCGAPALTPAITSNEYHVIVVSCSRTETIMKVYIDGEIAAEAPDSKAGISDAEKYYRGFVGFNGEYRPNYESYAGVPFFIKYFAMCSVTHSDEEVKQNSDWIAKTYLQGS